MKTCAFVLMAVGCVLANSACAAVIVLQPDESKSSDTFVYEGSADANLDIVAGGTFFGSLLGVGKTTSGHTAESLLKFDLPAISAAQVTSATLTMTAVNSPFGANPTPGLPVLVDLSALAGPFGEDTVTWNTPVPATGALYAQTSITAANQSFDFDVMSLVVDWLNTTITNNGVILKGHEPVVSGSTFAVVAFASSSSSTSANWPKLTITTVPEPGSVVLALTAAVGGLLISWRRLSRRAR